MKLIIANFKMQLTLHEELTLCTDLKKECVDSKNKIIVCPSFPALLAARTIFEKTEISLGAQTCSEYNKGPYTGQVSALSLAQAGCSYVLAGHSEQRSQSVTSQQVAQQALQITQAGLIPVVCIGESKQHDTFTNLEKELLEQLLPVHEALGKTPFYLAYEPVWAIGTQKTPSIKELTETLAWLKFTTPTAGLLYGGSVTPETSSALQTIALLNGFLVGGASTNLQKFKKILSLIH